MSLNQHHASVRAIRRRRRAAGAFTIVELLVSIAVIFVLITTAFVAFRKVKAGATRTDSLNALRQMVMGYTSYSGEHKQRLMPGFVEDSMIGPNDPAKLDLKARTITGHWLTPEETSSYVWRLAPYLDNAWKTYMVDYQSPRAESGFVSEFGGGDATGQYLNIATHPAFGLNSIFLGGDTTHGGSPFTDYSPWEVIGGVIQPRAVRLAATRVGDVKSPAKMIVFGPSQAPPPAYPAAVDTTPGYDVRLGYCELRAPMMHGAAVIQCPDSTANDITQQWRLNTSDGRVEYLGSNPTTTGVPIDRLGDGNMPVGRLDGSTGVEAISRLAVDMSRWAPFIVSND